MIDYREVFIASDHRGFEQKSAIIDAWDDILTSVAGAFVLTPLGPTTPDPNDDFPLMSKLVAEKVSASPNSLGILLCGTGTGVAMSANRFRGIRAVNAWSPEIARLGVEHNHANVLCLPADYLTSDEIHEIIRAFLSATPLTDEKYLRRVKLLDELGGSR